MLSLRSKEVDKIGKHARNLLEIRKRLLMNKKENSKAITKISKEINTSIRSFKKQTRSKILLDHIKKTGGIRTAKRELNDNTSWIPHMKNSTRSVINKDSILQIAKDFCKEQHHEDGDIDSIPES